MTTSLRAERLRLATTPAYVRMVLAAAVVAALSAFVGTATGPPPWDVSEPLRDGTAWMFVTTTVAVLAVVLGARAFTEEFRHSTIVHTVVADPRRRRSTTSKAIVAAVAAAVLAAVSVAAMAAVAYAMAAITGGAVAYHPSDATAALGLLAAAAAWGVLGVGLGALVRLQVPTIVGALLWLLIVENVAGVVLGPVSAYLPGKVAQALALLPEAATGMQAPMAGGILAAYALVLLLAGFASLRRRDLL